MTLTEIGDFISRVGFPVFVAIWFLLREDRCIKFLEQAHHENREVLNRIAEQTLIKE